MRDRLLAAPVVPAPEPWRRVFAYEYGVPVGGLLGIGSATDPGTGRDLVMVVSHDGHGLFDAVTGEKIARDRDPAPDDSTPDVVADLSRPGPGPLTASRVRIAGLFGGGLHTTTEDGWSLEVVTPAWPDPGRHPAAREDRWRSTARASIPRPACFVAGSGSGSKIDGHLS